MDQRLFEVVLEQGNLKLFHVGLSVTNQFGVELRLHVGLVSFRGSPLNSIEFGDRCLLLFQT